MIELKLLNQDSAEDLRLLHGVLEAAPSYWTRISAQPPEATAAKETFEAIPLGKELHDKFVLGIFKSGQMIGCCDLIRGFPNTETAMLGLLLLVESKQGKGYGHLSYKSIESYVRTWSEIRKIRIGVIMTNDQVLPFWTALGFTKTDERRPYEKNGTISETVVLEKILLK